MTVEERIQLKFLGWKMFLNFLHFPLCLFKTNHWTHIKRTVPLLGASNNHILNNFQHTNNFCIKKIKTIKVRFIIFHMETYINTCHMCKKSLKQSLLGRHQRLDGEVMPLDIKSKDGTAQSLGTWEITMHHCSLFQSRLFSSLEAGSLNTVCLTVAPICLNTKNCKKKRKK